MNNVEVMFRIFTITVHQHPATAHCYYINLHILCSFPFFYCHLLLLLLLDTTPPAFLQQMDRIARVAAKGRSLFHPYVYVDHILWKLICRYGDNKNFLSVIFPHSFEIFLNSPEHYPDRVGTPHLQGERIQVVWSTLSRNLRRLEEKK